MARPTKKNNEIKLKLADFIQSGLTVKDSCFALGISTSTFNRWRNSDIEFNRLIDEATKRGSKPLQNIIIVVTKEKLPTIEYCLCLKSRSQILL